MKQYLSIKSRYNQLTHIMYRYTAVFENNPPPPTATLQVTGVQPEDDLLEFPF